MSKKITLVACAACVALIGLADYLTGHEVVVGPFYLLPVIAGSLFAGPAAGGLLAVLCTAAWCVADRLVGHHYSHWWYFHWNAGMRLLSCVIVAALASVLGRMLGLDAISEEPGK